ncbi:hypothetical protein P389DRAFT_189139 [Cystobasidium minutum MCA 4210]|uniref:uncharacterized protein n=1 Tax=Cystobasidium minutum MCA 4210 TaxID=1397322 RepID=UPI0034CF7C12|eukprot:jgi/Rhomi1/189139/estExt_fgenesh1_pg.C_3_t20097
MAGGHGSHAPVKIDRSVEAWAGMREAVYKTFKFTPYTVRTSLVFAVAIPAIAYLAFSEEDNKWDWQGKKRSDALTRSS